jgi:hypothetical protein
MESQKQLSEKHKALSAEMTSNQLELKEMIKKLL